LVGLSGFYAKALKNKGFLMVWMGFWLEIETTLDAYKPSKLLTFAVHKFAVQIL
jgi:hypothetical protein